MANTPLPVYAKPARSFADQLAILQAKGMHIGDVPAAEARLASISYYRLSAYWYPFRSREANGQVTSQFEPGTSLDAVLELYEFDRALRLLVMDALERVEVAVRTCVTHHLGMAYGPFGHEDARNFHPGFDHGGWLQKMRAETTQSSDAFVAHFRTNYAGFPVLPIWMGTELISMGSLSRLYKGMRSPDKQAVAGEFHIHARRLQDWLHVLTYIRNVCAHHSRLWNRELAIRPQAMSEPEWKSPRLPRVDRVYCVLLMLRYLLDQSGNGVGWRKACTALLEPVAANDRWRTAMGMPVDWQHHPYWT
ncbi:MAG TPA: Abi family protein [Hydrogenophaga sp.]|uniref:Abi family protein n=1 Tax=Hydrogenophaga sp. TaxID=1904254 RepID=UPI002CD825AF|nr:Abi family protein [Hydrogenophaga sp.]HSX91371.1 Abi family protein [Hydrogenophaga sp.]